MPYYHRKDSGKVGFWTRKCEVCGKTWPLAAYFYPKPPKDMEWRKSKGLTLEIKKGTTSYAPWADRFPGAGEVASRLPNWPRWVRILTILTLTGVSILSILWILDYL